MMKQIIISLSICLCKLSIAQQFEVLYDHNGFSNDGGSIVKTDAGYFTTHLATDPVLSYTTLVAAFDEQGALLWDTSLSNPTETFSQPNWNVNILVNQTSQFYWILGNHSLAGDTELLPFLNKFTIDGQPIEIIVLDTLVNQRPDAWGGILNESGMYLLCRDRTLGGNHELLIAKCSLDGQYEWHLTYDTGFTFKPKCIVDVGDGFIVGGSRYATLTDQGNGDGQQYIRKFNYSGVSQWTNTMAYADNINLGAIGIVKLDNGNYLFAGTKYIDYVSMQPLIGELDAATGDTLWTKIYFESEPYDPDNLDDFNSVNRIHGFKKLQSGGYIGVGECMHEIIPGSIADPLDNAALMMKLDDEYNLLWKRIYVPISYAELEASQAQCQLNDFVENDDGSITAIGRVYMYTGTGPQGGYIQDSYLIRVDSLGCLVSGCSVGMTEFESVQNLLVYPNPATSTITIEFPQRDNWDVEIYDCQGQLAAHEKYRQSVKNNFDIHNLPSGIYTIKCRGENGTLSINKLIKE